MKPGPELDALVVVHVMNGKIYKSGFGLMDTCDFPDRKLGDPHQTIPGFSTNIARAWEVVEKMRSKEINFSLGNGFGGNKHHAWFNERIGPRNTGKCWDSIAPSAPHAICLAALKAVGYKV